MNERYPEQHQIEQDGIHFPDQEKEVAGRFHASNEAFSPEERMTDQEVFEKVLLQLKEAGDTLPVQFRTNKRLTLSRTELGTQGVEFPKDPNIVEARLAFKPNDILIHNSNQIDSIVTYGLATRSWLSKHLTAERKKLTRHSPHLMNDPQLFEHEFKTVMNEPDEDGIFFGKNYSKEFFGRMSICYFAEDLIYDSGLFFGEALDGYCVSDVFSSSGKNIQTVEHVRHKDYRKDYNKKDKNYGKSSLRLSLGKAYLYVPRAKLESLYKSLLKKSYHPDWIRGHVFSFRSPDELIEDVRRRRPPGPIQSEISTVLLKMIRQQRAKENPVAFSSALPEARQYRLNPGRVREGNYQVNFISPHASSTHQSRPSSNTSWKTSQLAV